MAVQIAIIDDTEFDELFERQENVDPELVALFETRQLGDKVVVTPEEGDTERKTKRRVNAAARKAGKELDWRSYNGKLIARLVATTPTNAEGEDVPRRRGRPRNS